MKLLIVSVFGMAMCEIWFRRARLGAGEQFSGSASKFIGDGANFVFWEQSLEGWSNFEDHGAKFNFNEQNQCRWSKNGGRRASLVVREQIQ